MVNERPRILIVDDDGGPRTTLALILRNKGYETETAGTGQEAIDKAQERALDVALLDIRLPDMEGVDLIAPLKEMQPAMEVIMITGYASVGTAVQALDERASAYKIKPLDMEGLLATIRDALEKQRLVREKRRAESQRDAMLEELRQSEERFRQFFENIPEYSYLISPEGAILDVNNAACRALGYQKEELVGKPLKTVYAPESLPKAGQLLNRWRETGQLIDEEMVILTREGDRRTVLLSADAVRDREGRVLHSISVQKDITERVQAEKERERLLVEIRQQAQRMQDVMDTVPEGVLLLDCSGHVVTANRVAKRDLATLADAKEGDVLTHLGGRPIAEFLTSPPTKGMWHEVAADGWVFEVIARPVEDGPEPTGWVLVMRDVTRERDVQRQVQQQERLAAVGQLAAGIAHDFNNIMAVIVLYSQLSRRDPDLPTDIRERLEIIDRQAKHATDLINQILDFSRRSVLERRPLDLEALVKEQFKLLQRTVPENIQVALAYGVEEYSVQADLTRMQQIIMNLALNARDAMLPTGGGELRIALSRMAPADETRVSCCGQVVAGRDGWVMLEVADTGTGIPEETLPHIFEPFYTTKERGRGTGLGLAQVYGIVEQHEGHIDVATRPGEGSTFTVYLPALPVPEPSAPPDRAPQELVEGHGETILVVEDDPELQSALVTSLAGLGYRTLQAPDGQAALALLAEQADDPSAPGIALVLSDLVMPRMGGQALFRALRQRDPAVRVVLLTGHPMEEELEELEAQGLNGWMLKPPNLERLAQLLERVLRDA